MEVVEDEREQALNVTGSLSRITVGCQCANENCGQLLPAQIHPDGVVEIGARCPHCGSINRPTVR